MKTFFFNLFFKNDLFIGYLTGLFGLKVDENGAVSSTYPMIWLYLIIFLLAIVSYLLGSINFSIIVSNKLYSEDIRNYGSKNAGATNMKRVYGKKAALLALLGDMMKGVVSCVLTELLIGNNAAYLSALVCVLGHCFPVYYKFKGGKGVATSVGCAIALNPIVGGIISVIFIIMLVGTKYVSVSSITALFLFPLMVDRITKLMSPASGATAMMIICAVLMAITVILKHHQNISRLFHGTESKFDFKKMGEREEEVKKPSLHSIDDEQDDDNENGKNDKN